MSDLIRSQLAQENDPKGIQRYLDNVWVLCGLLACVVAAAGWMAFGGMTDEQRFQKGVALMQSPAGADWIRARDEYFQPLVDKDPSAWEEKTSRFLKEIRIYSLEQRLLSSRRIGQRNAPRTEIERQMRRIRKLWDDGALAEAERRLRSVRILWKDDESAADMLRIATAWSEELQQQLATFPDPLPFVREKLRQADIQKAAEAEQTRQAIRELYSNDPLVEAAIMPRGETSSKVANESSHQ